MNNILYIFFSWKGNIKNCYNRIVNMMSNINYQHYIIVTGGEKETYFDNSKNRLYMKCNDFYEGLPEKVLETFKYLYKNKWTEKYDYFCKLDDDMIIKNILSLKKNTVHYTGYCILGDSAKKHLISRTWHFNKCTPGSYHDKRPYSGDFIDFCAGGYGYVLSAHSIEQLKDAELCKEDILEDLTIAILLKKKHIIPTPANYKIWKKCMYSPEHGD